MPRLLLFLSFILTACSEPFALLDQSNDSPVPTVTPPPAKPAKTETASSRPPSIAEPAKPTTEPIQYHQVAVKETLYSIGVLTGAGYQHLAEWNNIAPPYRITVGQLIRITPLTEAELSAKRRTEQEKIISSKSKKSIISIDNESMLKLNFKWPLRGMVVKAFSDNNNKGIDIEALEGQPVRATADGVVVHSGSGLIGFGQLLIIKHDETYLSAYANNGSLLVSEGQTVQQGEAIAEMGNTNMKRTVLHFEIRKNGKPIDPLSVLPPYH